MEAKVQAAEVISAETSVTPSPALSSGERADSPLQPQAPAAALSDPSEDFSRQLEDIIRTYGSAASLMEKKQPLMLEPENETTCEQDDDYVMVTTETGGVAKDQKKLMKGLGKEASLLMQSLNKLKTPQEKLDTVIKKYADMVEERRGEQRQLKFLQQKQGHMTKERDLSQTEHNRDVLARCQLEELCRELQRYNKTLKEESLQRSRQDEEKRSEISCHFQTTLTEIQAQIEQHSNRNNKLCQENANLADKLKSIINQYETREESLEKIFKHRDLQQKLADAKVEQANALLQEAQEKHKREREYLLREAIDKTKKCCTMKEQELQLKKKLVLYSQKFEEFQTTLSKSNDVYASFKQEMEKMTKKMNKLEKESGVWKTRFEECNKTLVEMIEERSVKEKEFGFFTVKIDKLEKLCQVLQDERKVLYGKIKEIRLANPGQVSVQDEDSIPGVTPSPDQVPSEHEKELEEEEPVLTEEMARLKMEQIRLQEFVTSLLNPSTGAGTDDDEDDDEDEDREGIAPTQHHVQVNTETQPQPKVQVNIETQSQPKVQVNTETQPQPEIQVNTETQPQPKVQVKTETQPQPKVQVNTETQPQPEIQVNTETQPQPKVQVKTETQPQPEIQVNTETQPQPKVQVNTETQPQPEVQVNTETQPQPEVQVNTETQPQSQPKPQVQNTSEPSVVPEQREVLSQAAEPVAAELVRSSPASPEVPVQQIQQLSEPALAPEPVKVEVEEVTEPPKPDKEIMEAVKPTPPAPAPGEKKTKPSGPIPAPATTSSSSSSKNTKTKTTSQSQPTKSGSSKRQTPKKKNAKKAS
ncbi:beta-taxilin [Aplochiton taeniatus]